MKNFIALCALGVVSVDAHKHHRKHQQQHAQKLSNKMLQQEIEQLRSNYASLEKKFESLTQTVKKQSLVQAPSPYGLAGPGGPAQPSPQPFVRGEKQWMDNGQNINDWGDKQVEAANTRIPYQSTAQVSSGTQGISLYGLAGGKGPAQPSPQPFVRGEKQWMDNAQNIGNWGENQMEIANARIPYASTLQTGTQGIALFGLGGAKGPAQPSPQPFVRGEKQWMDNAQNIGDWGDKQMTVANERIPYWSTVQLDSDVQIVPTGAPNLYGLSGPMGPAHPSPQPFVRGEKQWMDNAQNIGNWGENQMEIANARIPYWSTLQLDSDVQIEGAPPGPTPNLYGLSGPMGPAHPSPQPFVRGEKQWMDNAQNIGDWGDNQMMIANTRIPYWSTLVQTDSKDFDQDYEKEVDMNILYEKDVHETNPEKVSYENIPISEHLVQVRQDDDPSKMEGMLMEDTNIPLNLRLVHIETKEGNELIKIE